ncbi:MULTISPECIES: site-specific recombinase [unclassified Duganella]|uniref:site-specific recombinase n=1 Tax=unclassified Duganella TaxID=2636909 RepID=UPI00088738C8|nr:MULTISPECIES: site-specific recombinase [unclassified Duganella]SDH55924.1 Site-specific recombinase [Duganella sp. OV458]SDK67373.1 Site-specific recombinase [Duganella sp. OV510]
MLEILERINADSNEITQMVELFDTLRPKRATDGARAVANVRTLTQLLKGNPAHANALRNYARNIIASRRHSSLYTEIGVLSSDGFFSELRTRIAYRILPPALGNDYLSEALDQIVYKRTDYLWMAAVPAEEWLALLDVVVHSEQRAVVQRGGNLMLPGLLEAIRTLSYRVCAIGLEPRLTNFHTEMETYESPFMVQNFEVNAYLDAYHRKLAGEEVDIDDARHLLVMLDQCDAVIAKIRKKALNQGTSIALTYLLVSLTQSLDRMRKLLFLVDVHLPGEENDLTRRAAAIALALELIEAHNNKYMVTDLLRDNIDLLARNVTENASHTGEHYVANTRRELGAMFSSAAGAGLIIGFMALFKILLSYLHAAPLVEAFLFSMNYSLGFVFIHLLHFTVATKQPAMTASRIASGLHSRDGRNIDIDSMAELCNKVLRTQVMAVLGNLAICIPTAWLIAMAWPHLTGHHLVSPDKAMHLLADIDPIHAPTLIYAAIAGVCLFVAGLISGYYDNKALYTCWAQRIAQLRGLSRLLGQERAQRLGVYLENNLGGLMGNFFFGILLGMMPFIGFVLGMPLDIRHVTFSSANFATAIVGLDHNVSWELVVTSIAGFLSIGIVNLLVSFGLALWVALRSRQVRFQHGWQLLKALGRRFRVGPVSFLFGSKEDAIPLIEKVDK